MLKRRLPSKALFEGSENLKKGLFGQKREPHRSPNLFAAQPDRPRSQLSAQFSNFSTSPQTCIFRPAKSEKYDFRPPKLKSCSQRDFRTFRGSADPDFSPPERWKMTLEGVFDLRQRSQTRFLDPDRAKKARKVGFRAPNPGFRGSRAPESTLWGSPASRRRLETGF